ncbi:hypothetical protein EDC01DRAFT_133870 [Geopyxis carbonaria]|nr:hypothetical protein EDC01DRAFT_133870 [Geopyxis carbonaria]
MISLHFFVALFATSTLAAPTTPGQRSVHTSLLECLDSYSITTLVSTSANYSSAIVPFNLRVPWKPAAMAIPKSTDQIAAAVLCANAYDVKVAARGGGHSYAANGLGGADGSLVVDMKNFKSVEVDSETGIATVGAGNRLGDVASGLFAQGERAMPHGLCPGVGIAGHALHGGFGFTSRMWGTALDVIKSMEVVLADGSIVTTTATLYPDLFWALRGAGSSYGIVTSFTLQTHPAPTNGVQFTYAFANTTIDDKVRIFTAMQDYAQHTAPSNMALRLWTLTDVFEITGVFWGSAAAFNTTIAPLLDSWHLTPKPTITSRGWLASLSAFANDAPLAQPAVYTAHETFFAKSLVAPEPLTPTSLASFFTFMISPRAATAPMNWWVIADLYGGATSTINTHTLADASYAVRDALWTFQMYTHTWTQLPPFLNMGFDLLADMVDSIKTAQPETEFAAYPNYVDPTLEKEEAHRLYYGSQMPRLQHVKRMVDPKSRFWHPQAIGA